jgi:hypothetical protein
MSLAEQNRVGIAYRLRWRCRVGGSSPSVWLLSNGNIIWVGAANLAGSEDQTLLGKKEASVPDCIFCDTPLDCGTKPEHILLNALGGRKKTTKVICSHCNNVFGEGIDKALAEQVSVIRNMLQLPSGTRSTPPMLRNVKAGDDTLNIKGDGSLDLVTKPFSILQRPDGNVEVKIIANSLQEIEKLIPHIAAALQMPEDRLREQIVQADGSKVERRPDKIHFSLSLGGQDAIRSAAKACLVLWATLVGNNEIKGAAYDAVRHYVYEGDDVFDATRTHLDSRFVDNAEMIKHRYGPLFTLIYVRSNAEGRVIGHFRLYNAIAFQIVLAEKGGSRDRQIALVSNPLAPAFWSKKAAEEFDISFAWLDTPDYSDEMLERSLAHINAIMQQVMLPKEIGRICDDVFRKYGIKEDQNIADIERHDQIFDELIRRVAKHYLNLPHEEKFTAAQMLELFVRNPPTDSN